MGDRKRVLLLLCLVFLAMLATHESALATTPAYLFQATPVATLLGQTKSKIAFVSERDGVTAIYLMNGDGSDQHALQKPVPGTYVTMPHWSADGKQILFSLSYPVALGATEVHIVNVDGSNPRVIVTAKNTDNAEPDLSPDGKYIAFLSNQDGPSKVYVMNVDGSNPHRLTNLEPLGSPDPKDQSPPSWSPTEDVIAFLSIGKNTSELQIARLDGLSPEALVSHATGFAWSPDGQSLAFISEDQTNMCVITIRSKHEDCLSGFVDVLGLSWSPDGQRIAFSAAHGNGYDVYVADVNANQVRRLTDNSALTNYRVPTNYNAVWSADGKRLSFVSSDDVVAVSSLTAAINVIDVSGANLEALTAQGNRSFSPVWQP